jgi:N-acetylneuraminic acid mutarotase
MAMMILSLHTTSAAGQGPHDGTFPAMLRWQQLTKLPGGLGVAGAFAGVSQGKLIVAGGANFPGKMPWEGGKKVWHDEVYALAEPQGEWKCIGKLPRPLAYGCCVTAKEGIVCMGGSDEATRHREVFLLTLDHGTLISQVLPSLPVPLENAACGMLGHTIYVACGTDQPGEQSALNRFFSLDLSQPQASWMELAPVPGKGRILALAATSKDTFFLVGGAALEPVAGKISRVYLREAWSYRPAHGWRRIADLPRPSVAAASPAPWVDRGFFVIGGDDGANVGFQPVAEHPGFSKTILAYDAAQDTWSAAGEAPASRATLPVAQWRGRFILPSGEVRPGVRSPEVWGFTAAEGH